MQSNRDKIIEGTAQAEQLLRDIGAHGRNLGELAQGLADRKILPSKVLRRLLVAERIAKRAADESAALAPIELHQWTEAIRHLTDWLDQRANPDKAPSKRKVRPEEVRTLGIPRKTGSLRIEPWMLVGALVPIVALAGAAWNFRGDIARYPAQLMQSGAPSPQATNPASGAGATSAIADESTPQHAKKHGRGTRTQPTHPVREDQDTAG